MAQQAETSHYRVQLSRRAAALEEWRLKRRELAKGSAVRMEPSPLRGINVGMLVGGERGPAPGCVMDARILELPPGASSSLHRHTADAVVFVLEGRGQTTIDGQTFQWGPWDALHLPSWSWHGHANLDPARPARLLAVTDAPLLERLRLTRLEDIGAAALEPSPEESRALPLVADTSEYGAEVWRAARLGAEYAAARRVTRWSEVELRVNEKGTRSAFLVDSSLGYRTSGLSMVMFQIPPGGRQRNHRHCGEAFLYIVEGRGYSVIDGVRHDWEAGDAVIVGKWAWHQHFNADPQSQTTIIRMHMWETLTGAMEIMVDPIALYEE